MIVYISFRETQSLLFMIVHELLVTYTIFFAMLSLIHNFYGS